MGEDLVTTASDDALAALNPSQSHAVVNAHPIVTGVFARDADFELAVEPLNHRIEERCGGERTAMMDFSMLAEALTGNTIGANIVPLGFASQRGLLPVTPAAFELAIREADVSVECNLGCFRLGRVFAHVPQTLVSARAEGSGTPPRRTLDQVFADRSAELVRYQNQRYAARYRAVVERVREIEAAACPGSEDLSRAVAENFYWLLAYKGEYEVARLYVNGGFRQKLVETFDCSVRLRLRLAPPLLARRDTTSGRPCKMSFGPRVFTALHRRRRRRDTVFDVLGYTAERRVECALITRYQADLEAVTRGLRPETLPQAVALARLSERIRGFGPVMEHVLAAIPPRWAALSQELRLSKASA